jgi:peptidyl-prolyl cis-trans isomerase A (cyclophilin A)
MIRSALVALLGFTATAAAQPGQPAAPPVRVAIDTSLGRITVVLDVQHAPRTSCNFLRYVRAGNYAGGAFYRSVHKEDRMVSPVPIEVVQAAARKPMQDVFGPIELETTQQTGLRHSAGTISMARGEPNSATSSFFLVVADAPALDFGGQRNRDGQGFAAFGKVIEGMEVARAIHDAPARNEAILDPVAIQGTTLFDPWRRLCGT